jgi:hypothetical protein
VLVRYVSQVVVVRVVKRVVVLVMYTEGAGLGMEEEDLMRLRDSGMVEVDSLGVGEDKVDVNVISEFRKFVLGVVDMESVLVLGVVVVVKELKFGDVDVDVDVMVVLSLFDSVSNVVPRIGGRVLLMLVVGVVVLVSSVKSVFPRIGGRVLLVLVVGAVMLVSSVRNMCFLKSVGESCLNWLLEP